MTIQRTVMSAAAGTGKTTRLVREYLSLLSEPDLSPHRIIAITFTRKAAAELVERVTATLRIADGDETVPEALKREHQECYADVTPAPGTIRAARRELLNAPVGTTDSFVQTLLTDHALHARLPVPDRTRGWLDLPFGQGDSAEQYRLVARDVLDPPSGAVPAAAEALLEHLTLGEVIDRVVDLIEVLPDAAPVATEEELVGATLAVTGDVFRSAFAETDRFDGLKVTAPDEVTVPVRRWVDAGMGSSPPLELLDFTARLLRSNVRKDPEVNDMAKAAVHAAEVDFGVARVDLRSLIRAMGRATPGGAVIHPDGIRTHLLALAQEVRDRAWDRIAESGALDYGLLTEAAIHLCEDPPPELRGRFGALLVDEVQDSSPLQHRLYRALEGLVADGRKDGRSFYVGDARQSIYLFQGAEPETFRALEQNATGGPKTLDTNYRSSPALVDATRTLFSAVLAPSELPPLAGVEAFGHVGSHPPRAKQALGAVHGDLAAPIVMVLQEPSEDPEVKPWKVGEANAAGLDVFVERLRKAWAEDGHGDDTAAVLTGSWHKARVARDRIRTHLGPEAAFLDGGRELARARICRDVRVLVRALWDRSDDIAWAAVWKLPCVGLSDAGLVALRTADGGQLFQGLSRPVFQDVSDGALDPADRETMGLVRPVLQRALRSIGREPTVAVVEDVAAALRWRPILEKGPDGWDAVAQLEAVLDWIRRFEEAGVDPEGVLHLLDPGPGGDPPRINLRRGDRTVSCTTVHQAKGLKYHHVFVYDIGTGPGQNMGGPAQLGCDIQGAPRRLVGVGWDPAGGIHPRGDLCAVAVDKIWDVRKKEEFLRLAYVAVTRAVRSVTFTLFPGGQGIQRGLYDRWIDEDMDGVYKHQIPGPVALKVSQGGHAVPLAPLSTTPAPPRGWALVSPSAAALAYGGGLKAFVASVADRAHLEDGGARIEPPDLTDAAGEKREIESAAWGTLVHGWLEHTGLAPERATDDEAAAYLRDVYRLENAALAAWLLRISASLEERRPELLARLRDASMLDFEVPFVGVDHTDDPRLHAGSIDLLARWPDKRCWVIDFKAGQRSPTRDNPVASGKLDEYVPQLEAYRRSLVRMGWTVERTGILYVRTGAFLWW